MYGVHVRVYYTGERRRGFFSQPDMADQKLHDSWVYKYLTRKGYSASAAALSEGKCASERSLVFSFLFFSFCS